MECAEMGNRAVITTEENFVKNSGLGIYLHWQGGRDSVRGFLEYCRLRSFRTLENDDYGWARLCQVIGNFMGADGCSVGIDDITRLDMDNGDNGVYLIKDWRIIGRRYFDGEEQNCYGFHEFLHAVDESQPEGQQLGKEMIECLLYHDMVISDISWNYQYEMNKRKEEGKKVDGFHIGRFYTYNEKDPKSFVKVIDKTEMDLILEVNGEEGRYPRLQWKDGSESTVLVNEYGRRITLDSSKEVIA